MGSVPSMRWWLILGVVLCAVGCGGGGGLPDGGEPDAGVSVAIFPPTTTVLPSGRARLVAQVTGTSATGVVWSVEEPTGGRITNEGTSASYQAPSVEGIFHVKATSVADTTKTATATVAVSNSSKAAIQILPEPVSGNAFLPIQPAARMNLTAVYVMAGVSLSALVPVPEAQWSVIQGGAGGGITPDGIYVASPTTGTYHVLATVPDAPTKSAIAEVAVSPVAPPTLSVSPAISRIAPGGTVQLSEQLPPAAGTVSWTVLGGSANGTVTSFGRYTAPSTPGVYVVRARVGGSVPDALATIIVQ